MSRAPFSAAAVLRGIQNAPTMLSRIYDPGSPPVTVPAEVMSRAKTAWTRWHLALQAAEYTGGDRLESQEQEAYTALCDFCEENNLNYTEFDPRGDGS